MEVGFELEVVECSKWWLNKLCAREEESEEAAMLFIYPVDEEAGKEVA